MARILSTSSQLNDTATKPRILKPAMPQQKTDEQRQELAMSKGFDFVPGKGVLPQKTTIEKVGDVFNPYNNAKELTKGFIKRAGRTGLGIIKSAASSFPILGVAGLTPTVEEKVGEAVKPIEEKLQPSNPAQKLGGYAETATELLAPTGAAKQALKAPEELKTLELTPEILKNVDKRKLEFLGKDILSEGKTIGGTFKEKMYATPKKVQELATEFKDVLTGGSTEEKIKKVRELGNSMKKETLNLFEDSKKSINEKILRNRLTRALNKDVTTSYASEFEKKDATKKAIDGFINSVKEGTNKGIEEARMNWYQKAKNVKGKLGEANQVLHDAIKKVVKETLPEEKQAIYDQLKQKMAKSFDVKEILKARVRSEIGTSKVKDVLKKLAPSAAVLGAYEGAKKLITGRF